MTLNLRDASPLARAGRQPEAVFLIPAQVTESPSPFNFPPVLSPNRRDHHRGSLGS